MNRLFLIVFGLIFVFSWPCIPALRGQDSGGQKIYASQCASCHGEQGQGVKGKYKQPLTGDLTLEALAEVIEGTMPEADPDLCVEADADAVAKYIFDEFYSPKARLKKSPSIELTHRTNLQLKQSLVDLAGRFSGKLWIDENLQDRGFKGKFFSSRSFDSTKVLGERIDGKIDFDFGSESPYSPGVEMDEFAIQWFAALKVEETGIYDFFVETPNGFRLFVNEDREPVIDAWVSTGQTEHEASVFLLGGRHYLLKLDMFKYQEDGASIKLTWKPPLGKPELIPPENLLPIWAPVVAVPNVAMPADDSSSGYARGISVSKPWLSAASESAIQFSNVVFAKPRRFLKIRDTDTNKPEKYKKFCQKLATFAFSRPLTEELRQRYVDSLFENTDSPELAAKQSILLILSSPRFLYPELGTEEADSFTVASRLALTFWDSIPDQELWSAAQGGNLNEPWGIKYQVDRMLKDPRAKAKIRSFFHHWLEMDSEDLTKDSELYPDFNKALAADLRKSLELFIDDVVWSEGSDYRRLYQGNTIFVNQAMSTYYGISTNDTETPSSTSEVSISPSAEAEFEGFRKVQLAGQQRMGILTHPYLMTSLSYHRTTSPIHRGVFVARRLLGRTLNQPPENFEPLKEDFDPTLTTRERVAYQTKDKSCMTCHSIINPLGFSLESFDATGSIRETEKDKPINTQSRYSSEKNDNFEWQGAADLANYLVDNELAQRNFIKHLFQHLIKQPPQAYGIDTLDLLHQSFVQSEFNIQQLIKDIASLTALHETEGAAKLEIVKPQPESNPAPDAVPTLSGEIEFSGSQP